MSWPLMIFARAVARLLATSVVGSRGAPLDHPQDGDGGVLTATTGLVVAEHAARDLLLP